MKNWKGDTVKPLYEVALKQHVKGDTADDYESVGFIGADNYKEACKIAKAQSENIDKHSDGRFYETERLDAGLAMVSVCCYFADDTRFGKRIMSTAKRLADIPFNKET